MFHLLLNTFRPGTLLTLAILYLFIGCNDESNPNAPAPSGPIPSIFNWTFQDSEYFFHYKDVHFVNDKVGWVVGENNVILSTVSGGSQWPEAPVSSFEGTFRSVFLIDENLGWITGDLNGAEQNGLVYISTSGGAYPEAQISTKFPINAINMIDKNYGWAVGENGLVLLTTDGENWSEVSISSNATLHDVYFVDQTNGWITAANGVIYSSKDGGINWEIEYDDPGTDLLSIHLSDETNGWACGSNNTLLIRNIEEGNIVWTKKSIAGESIGITWTDLQFIDEKNGWIVGNAGRVYKSTDGGENWSRESTGILSKLNAIHMVSNLKGWIAGDDGTILTYTP